MHAKAKTGSIKGLYSEWLKTLESYLLQLQSMDSATRLLQSRIKDLALQHEILVLRNKMLLQKNVLSAVAGEVSALNRKNTSGTPKEINIARMAESEHLRERILKTEQGIFTLQYQAGQLLSKAS
jgi:hypothetical protein